MDGDRGFWRLFAYLNLFMFSMLVLIFADNFLLLYVGWEMVGLCSYLLIGFWYKKPSAAGAAKKAFVVNRIGDFGFGLGVIMIWVNLGTLSFHEVFERIGTLDEAPFNLRPEAEIWTKRREAWLPPVDGATQHEQNR